VSAMLEQDAGGRSILDQSVTGIAKEVFRPAVSVPTESAEFGPYQIKSLLGEGGMGVVYLAERRDLGNLAAIKILRDAWVSPSRRMRFAAEQRTLAQLNHPSIARLYDAGTLRDGTPFFVMEYVDGTSLTQYCQAHECSIRTRLELFRRTCEAV